MWSLGHLNRDGTNRVGVLKYMWLNLAGGIQICVIQLTGSELEPPGSEEDRSTL